MIFNVTPNEILHSDLYVMNIDIIDKLVSDHSELIDLIFNITVHFFESSGLIADSNATEICHEYYTFFYPEFIKALDLLVAKIYGGIQQLLFSFKALNPIYVECKNVLIETIENFKEYFNNLININQLLTRIIMESKDLTIRAQALYKALIRKDYIRAADHAGIIVRILLGP